MKVFIATVFACLYAASCFAGQPEAVAQGKIKAVTVADQARGTKSEISVVDQSGQTGTYLVKSTTTIYDPEFKAIRLGSLKAGADVKVKYTTTREGVREAVSVNELK